MLKDFSAKTGIRVERTEEPDYEQMFALFDELMYMSDGVLHQMPKELAEMLRALAEAGELPDPLAERINKLFRRK